MKILMLSLCVLLSGCNHLVAQRFKVDIAVLPDSDPLSPIFEVTKKNSWEPKMISHFFVWMETEKCREVIWECSGDPLKPGGELSKFKYGEVPTGWYSDLKMDKLKAGYKYGFATVIGDYGSGVSFEIIEKDGKYILQTLEQVD